MNQCVAAGVFPNNQVWLTVRRPSSSVRCPSTIQRSSTLSPRSRTSSCGSEIPTSALTLSARGSSRTSRRRKALERSASRPSPSRSFPGQSGEEFGTPRAAGGAQRRPEPGRPPCALLALPKTTPAASPLPRDRPAQDPPSTGRARPGRRICAKAAASPASPSPPDQARRPRLAPSSVRRRSFWRRAGRASQ